MSTYRRNTATTEAGGRIPYVEPAPATVDEVLDDNRKFRPAAANAVREFRASKPWRGTPQERFDKLVALHDLLCVVYGISTELRLLPFDDAPQGYDPEQNVIQMHAANLSVVSYFYCFGLAIGYGPAGARAWGFNLFRRFFPRSFARLVPIGNVLVTAETAERVQAEAPMPVAMQSLLDMLQRRGGSMN